MSDRRLEKTSALLDNQIADQQQLASELDVLLADEEACRSWQRYALIGQVMRGEAELNQPLDISAQVRSRLAAEPAVKGTVVKPEFGQRARPAANSGGTLINAASRWLKPAGSIAIAASVAVVAVLSVQQPLVDPAGTEGVEPTLVTTPFGGRNPVSYNTVIEDNNPSQAELAQQRKLLQAYMRDHQQQLQLSLQERQSEAESELAPTVPVKQQADSNDNN